MQTDIYFPQVIIKRFIKMLSFAVVPVEPILAHVYVVYVAKRHGKSPEQPNRPKI